MENNDLKLELIWKATKDGFGANIFHLKCNNIPKTILLVKSKEGLVFGGYNDLFWKE